MKTKSKSEMADESRPEYNLRKLLKAGLQGKYVGAAVRERISFYSTQRWPRCFQLNLPSTKHFVLSSVCPVFQPEARGVDCGDIHSSGKRIGIRGKPGVYGMVSLRACLSP